MSARILAATTMVVAALVSRVHAQPEREVKNGRVTIPVFLTPTDYLKPVSRAYLLPQYAESIPGNRVQMFLRCFMEQANFFGQAESERRQKWNELPLRDLPLNEVGNYGSPLIDRDMYDAARMTQVDWQLWFFLRRDGFNTLLPDAQKMRAQAEAMKTRVRGQIAAGDHEGAIHTLKTLFGLAHTFDSHPSLIGHLIGVAIATMATDAVLEMIQQPGCPSLYWALMDLPTPLLSLRLGNEGERLMLTHEIEPLKSAPDATELVLLKQIDRLNTLIVVTESERNEAQKKAQPSKSLKSILEKRAGNADEVKAARERIIRLGCDDMLVRRWSPLHVVLIDEELHCEQYRDEVAKFMNLPYWQAKPGIDQAIAEISEKRKQWTLLALVPPMATVKRAQARLDQRIAYLQVLEAIRLHAFKNGGSLPATLADIKLPLPVDPVTGRPFEYKVDKGVATLHGENPNPQTEQTNRYYEILLSK